MTDIHQKVFEMIDRLFYLFFDLDEDIFVGHAIIETCDGHLGFSIHHEDIFRIELSKNWVVDLNWDLLTTGVILHELGHLLIDVIFAGSGFLVALKQKTPRLGGYSEQIKAMKKIPEYILHEYLADYFVELWNKPAYNVLVAVRHNPQRKDQSVQEFLNDQNKILQFRSTLKIDTSNIKMNPVLQAWIDIIEG